MSASQVWWAAVAAVHMRPLAQVMYWLVPQQCGYECMLNNVDAGHGLGGNSNLASHGEQQYVSPCHFTCSI